MSAEFHIGLLTPAFAGITGLDSGIGTHFRHLADGLTAAGQRVSVLVVTDKPTLPAKNFPYGIETVTISQPAAARLAGRFGWQLHQWLTLRAVIRSATRAVAETKVDLWETTSTGSLALDFLRRTRRPPVAVRVSTTAAQLRTTNAGGTHWIDRRIETWEKATILRANRVLTHSASHRAAIAKQFGLSIERIPIIPHGIPMPPATARAPLADRCRILYVGRLEHRKGIDLLVEALPALLLAVPCAEVTLVGADRDRYWENQWHQKASPDLRERVRFAGMVDAVALSEHYNSADIFVAPSRYESFGLMFVEAMANALPVVALRTPGATDLIEDGITGLLAPPEDVPGLAAALVQVATDRSLQRRLGSAARRVVEKRYSIAALAAASTAFYREMLAR
jgi:glycosyltransferase involved in cell wall biosynthesis